MDRADFANFEQLIKVQNGEIPPVVPNWRLYDELSKPNNNILRARFKPSQLVKELSTSQYTRIMQLKHGDGSGKTQGLLSRVEPKLDAAGLRGASNSAIRGYFKDEMLKRIEGGEEDIDKIAKELLTPVNIKAASKRLPKTPQQAGVAASEDALLLFGEDVAKGQAYLRNNLEGEQLDTALRRYNNTLRDTASATESVNRLAQRRGVPSVTNAKGYRLVNTILQNDGLLSSVNLARLKTRVADREFRIIQRAEVFVLICHS